MEIPTESPTTDPRFDDDETCWKNMSKNSNNYMTTRNYPNYALTLTWRLSKEDNISSHLIRQKDRAEWYIFAENISCFVTIRELEREAGFVGVRKLVQSWTYMFVIMKIVIVLKLSPNLCFKTTSLLGFELIMELKSTLPRRQKPLKMKSIELREIYCQSKNTNEVFNSADIRHCSSTWKKVDGHQSWGLWS